MDNGAIAPIADAEGHTLARPTLSANVSLTIVASAKISATALLFESSSTVRRQRVDGTW